MVGKPLIPYSYRINKDRKSLLEWEKKTLLCGLVNNIHYGPEHGKFTESCIKNAFNGNILKEKLKNLDPILKIRSLL